MTDTSEPMGWCTNWSAYGVRELYAMVANEEDRPGRDQAMTWLRLEESVRAQCDRLAACRESLMETWPPEKSPAAAAFVAHIDELTASMTTAALAASSNRVALEGVIMALSDAKEKLKPLAEKFQDKSGDWIPSFVDDAEDEITEQARQIMANTDVTVNQYSANLVPVPSYRLKPAVDPDGDPLPPRPPTTRSGAGGPGGGAVPLSSPLEHNPPAPLPGMTPVMPPGQEWTGTVPPPSSGGGDGPGLVGIGPPAPPAPPVTPLPGPGPAPVPVPGPGPGPVPPVGPGLGGPWPSNGPLSKTGIIGPVNPASVRGGQPAGRVGGGAGLPRQAMPPGGVIGGSNAAAGRAGVAGGRGAVAGARPGQGTTGTAGAAAGSGRRPAESEQAESVTLGNPDNPWEVEQGVPPVIIPPRAPRRPDPGPSVIGIQR